MMSIVGMQGSLLSMQCFTKFLAFSDEKPMKPSSNSSTIVFVSLETSFKVSVSLLIAGLKKKSVHVQGRERSTR